jgi:hypothetical protein
VEPGRLCGKGACSPALRADTISHAFGVSENAAGCDEQGHSLVTEE